MNLRFFAMFAAENAALARIQKPTDAPASPFAGTKRVPLSSCRTDFGWTAVSEPLIASPSAVCRGRRRPHFCLRLHGYNGVLLRPTNRVREQKATASE